MSEKFGGLTTTPIKPSAFGGGSVTDKMDKFGELTIDKTNHKAHWSLNEYDEVVIEGIGIVIRGLADPEWDVDAVNKRYVDNKIGNISSALDELHTYAQSLINGGATE